jgi:hypothetical protein
MPRYPSQRRSRCRRFLGSDPARQTTSVFDTPKRREASREILGSRGPRGAENGREVASCGRWQGTMTAGFEARSSRPASRPTSVGAVHDLAGPRIAHPSVVGPSRDAGSSCTVARHREPLGDHPENGPRSRGHDPIIDGPTGPPEAPSKRRSRSVTLADRPP